MHPCLKCGQELVHTDGKRWVCVPCHAVFIRTSKKLWYTERHWKALEHRRWFWVRDGGVCGICTMPVSLAKFTIDHIVPLSRGGADTVRNKQIAHLECNQRKANRTDEEYATFVPLDQIARSA